MFEFPFHAVSLSAVFRKYGFVLMLFRLHPVLGLNLKVERGPGAVCLSPYFPTVLLPASTILSSRPTICSTSPLTRSSPSKCCILLNCICSTVWVQLCILNCDSFWQKTPLTGQQRECKRQERFLRNCKSIPHFWGSKGNCPPSSLKGGSRGWGLCVKIRWTENAGDNDVLGKFQGLTLPLIPDPPPSMFSQLLNRITRVHSASH